MTQYVVTPRGSQELVVGGEHPAVGSVVDTTGWQTIPTLIAQGLLKEVVELPDKPSPGTPLPKLFPYEAVLLKHGFRTLEAVHYLTDRQLEDLPEIGEVGVRNIRAFVAARRGETVLTKDRVELSDVLSDSEAELILISRGEKTVDYAPPKDGGTEGITVGPALKAVVEALDAVGFLEIHLSTDELMVLRLSRPDFDPTEILEAMRAEDGSYTLGEPLRTLLERLGLTYLPPQLEPLEEPTEPVQTAPEPPPATDPEEPPEKDSDKPSKAAKRPAKK